MKFLAAYLLAQLGAASAVDDGGEEASPAPTPAPPPGKDDVRRILESVGANVEEDRLDFLFSLLEGKGDLAELIAAGRERLAYAPCCGGAAGMAVGSAAAAPGAAAAAAAAEDAKAEEKVEEEDDEGLGFSLFDD